jgi:hypothetical protein
MKSTAPSGRIWGWGTACLALKHQAIQMSPFQGGFPANLKDISQIRLVPRQPGNEGRPYK